MIGDKVEFTADTFKNMMSALKSDEKWGMKGVSAEDLASGKVGLSKEAINELTRQLGGQRGAKKGLSNIEDQMIIFQAGINKWNELEEQRKVIQSKKDEIGGSVEKLRRYIC